MLKIAVCIKQVPDPQSVEIHPLSGAIKLARLVYIINPPDLEAVELALRWRDMQGGEVQVYSVGAARVDKALRDCLAMGVDGVTRLPLAETQPSQTALALAATLKTQNFDLILCGNRSADNGSGQVPARLAALLDIAQATSVISADLQGSSVALERKLERGRRARLNLPLPALLALEKGIAEPRYAALPAYMQAQRVSIMVVEVAAEAKTVNSGVRHLETRLPRPRPRQIFIPNPDLPAAARIQAILSGGTETIGKKGSPVEGTPEEQADRIMAFLEARGLLEPD